MVWQTSSRYSRSWETERMAPPKADRSSRMTGPDRERSSGWVRPAEGHWTPRESCEGRKSWPLPAGELGNGMLHLQGGESEAAQIVPNPGGLRPAAGVV